MKLFWKPTCILKHGWNYWNNFVNAYFPYCSYVLQSMYIPCFNFRFFTVSSLFLFPQEHIYSNPIIVIWSFLTSNLQVKYLAEAVGAGMGGPVQGFLNKILKRWAFKRVVEIILLLPFVLLFPSSFILQCQIVNYSLSLRISLRLKETTVCMFNKNARRFDLWYLQNPLSGRVILLYQNSCIFIIMLLWVLILVTFMQLVYVKQYSNFEHLIFIHILNKDSV